MLGRQAPADARTAMADREPMVRFAGASDLSACVELDPHVGEDVLARKIEAGEVVLAEVNGEPAGYLRLEYLWSKVPYIGLIFVVEERRGCGVGRAMLAFVEGFLRGRSYRVLLSSSQADEAEPQAWHRRMGFEECGVLSGINDGGVGEIFFRKRL